MKHLTTGDLLTKWEAQREIKNTMGKMTNCIILNREAEIFASFWSQAQDDVCLGLNDGWYIGKDAVSGYYSAERDRCMLVALCLQKQYPHLIGGKSPDEIFGIGVFKDRPLYAPIIEIADDMETAKGLWYCMGTYANVDTAGPVAHWTWGYYAADFIKERGTWKIWHLQYVNDVDCICGQSWGKLPVPYPDLPEFEPLRDFKMPEPTVRRVLREYYHPLRAMEKAPEIPQPYVTFSETFSYGAEVRNEA